MTLRRLALRSEAEDDIDDAVAWYAARSKPAALNLIHELDAVYERILESPLQFPVVTQDVRRALLDRFPYGVYYVEVATFIEVVAVLHLMRYPETWRLRDR